MGTGDLVLIGAGSALVVWLWTRSRGAPDVTVLPTTPADATGTLSGHVVSASIDFTSFTARITVANGTNAAVAGTLRAVATLDWDIGVGAPNTIDLSQSIRVPALSSQDVIFTKPVDFNFAGWTSYAVQLYFNGNKIN